MSRTQSSTFPVAVVGAGWAGLAAAATLAGRNIPVSVFEASRQPGGRARRVRIEGVDLDIGQHIFIGAYRETLALMRKVGADPDRLLLRIPLELRYCDGFRLKVPRLPAPIDLLVALFAANGLSFAQRLRAARFVMALRSAEFRIEPDRPVTQLLSEHAQHGRLRTHLWEPLCVSALNTPVESASAQVFANVLRDGLVGERGSSDLMLARTNLGALLPEPAVQYVRKHGGTVEFGAHVRSIRRDGKRFCLDERAERFQAVIIACSPQHALPLLADLKELAPTCETIAKLAYEPIVTCYLQYSPEVSLPAPMIGISGGLVQWAFDRGSLDGPPGLLAAVISASGVHQKIAKKVLARHIENELRQTLGSLPAPRWSRLITERRATFSCVPGLVRPPALTAVPGLLLAGDYTESDYPGTLEAAVRSGIRAAGHVDPE